MTFMIVDAKDLILGRLASRIAKKLLGGEEVTIVNAEMAVLSGRRKSMFTEYEDWTKIRNLVDPTQGPFHPKKPEDLVRKAVRGMLPMKKAKGRKAYERLKAYSETPTHLRGKERETIPEAKLDQLGTSRFIRVRELSEHLGAEPG